MRDTEFITRLRKKPCSIQSEEFEEKVLLDHVSIENYDLLIGHNLAKSVLAKIIELQSVTLAMQDVSILECDLAAPDIMGEIGKVYNELYSINGLWMTRVSKIAHLLNDKLFAILNLDISNHCGLLEGDTGLVRWLKITRQNAQEVTQDFHDQGFPGSLEKYLSEKLGYTSYGYEKSLIKFIDEYFWLRFGDKLPVPPRWVPPVHTRED